MKYAIGLIFVLSLVSCDSKHGPKSQSCKFNDRPIDCTEINHEKARAETSLIAQVSSKIMFFNDFMETKERNTDFKKETINGRLRVCEVSTNNLTGFFFHFNEENLYLRVTDFGESVVYTKLNGPINSIYGSWENSVEEVDHKRNTILNISEGTIQIIAKCIFK